MCPLYLDVNSLLHYVNEFMTLLRRISRVETHSRAFRRRAIAGKVRKEHKME